MRSYYCLECLEAITEKVFDYSTDVHRYPLCIKHQNWLVESNATKEAVILYFALKAKELPVKLEHSDGKKTVDIAIPDKIHIEVDGKHHYQADQALTDFLRSSYSWENKIPTFRVLNAHIRNQYYLGIVVDRITEMFKELRKTG